MDRVLQDVEAIAQDVRYWTEGRSKNDDLNGWCAVASGQLFRNLSKEGYTPEIHVFVNPHDGQSSHVFLVVEDHVVDVTATQFKQLRNQPVVIMHQREAEAYDFYNGQHVFHNIEALRSYQHRNRWPTNQIAYAK